MPKD
jgi:hypothetical protein